MLRYLFPIILGLIGLRQCTLQPPILEETSFSRLILDEEGRLLRVTLSSDEKYRIYTPLEEVSPQFLEATLLQEDRFFYYHLGVNPVALLKAIWQTYFLQHRQVGASTITMQLARMHYGLTSNQIVGKVQQILRALQLELFYSKNEILEAYVNLASYGGNVEGVGAASAIYFGKQANQLNLPEALGLSVIPQNPKRRKLDSINRKSLIGARAQLYQRWVSLHPEDLAVKELIELPFQQTKRKLPFHAPHFVEQLLQAKEMQSTSKLKHSQIPSTLNLPLQHLVEKITRCYLEQQNIYGIDNAAILLVDSRDMGIKALLGSGNYFNSAICGQMNGTKVKRSPGSTLKPFVYALALDQGLIHPNTVLKDVPTHFGDYSPENIDRDYLGPLKAKEALIFSRNIPAIDLAAQLQNPTLYELLEKTQVSCLRPERSYGLSLVLGSAEVTLQELATLYAMLVNRGVWKPLKECQQETFESLQLLTPEACFLTLEMLKETPRPYPASDFTYDSLPVYWKTGTSSAYRDAWTIGIFGPYVLGVWIGDFQGKGNPALLGATAAAPLFFNLIEAIRLHLGNLPNNVEPSEELNLTKTEVCEASGMLPNPDCPHSVSTWFIPGKSPIKSCTLHRRMSVDHQTEGSNKADKQNTHFVIYEFWPSDLRKIFSQAGIPVCRPLPVGAKKVVLDGIKGAAPQILSPLQGVSYIMHINKHNPPIVFSATVEADVRKVYWFLNQTCIGGSEPDQPLEWDPSPGRYTITVVDDFGRAAQGELEVIPQDSNLLFSTILYKKRP